MKLFVACFLVVFQSVITTSAQEQASAPSINACRTQVEVYCQNESAQKDLREIIKCLIKNDDKLSAECKQEIQRFAQVGRQTSPPGGHFGGIGSLAGFGAQVPSISYEGNFISKSEGNPPSPTVKENSVNVSIPVFKSERDTVALIVGGGTFHMDSPVTLDSGLVIPNDLYKAEAGLQYSRRLEEKGKAIGLRGSVGYAGDKINDRTQSFNLIANYSFPGSAGGQWVTMLFISNNSPFGAYVPVPGFFYIHRTPAFTGLFGVPVLSMQWTPVNPWSFSFSAFGPAIKTEAAYGAIDQIQFFTGLGFKQQKYLLSNRVEDKDRLTFEEKSAETGLRSPLLPGVFSELKVGYSFDRSAYVGQGLFNKDSGSKNLDSSWYLKWSARIVF